MNKGYWPALVLIGLGVLLLLHQFDRFDINFVNIITYGFIIWGIILFGRGLTSRERKGILGGTFFISFGVVLLLMRQDILVRDDEFGIACFFLALSFANFVYFLFRTEKWSNFTSGIIFGVVGGLVLMSYTGYYPSWYIYDQIEKFWPVVLILWGLTIILKAYKKRHSISPNQI